MAGHEGKPEIIISRLSKLYSDEGWHKGMPFEVLIATVLSHRTRDEMTARASERLFEKYGTPEALARALPGEVEPLIRDVGFYRVKSARIIRIAGLLIEKFGGRVPDDMDSLLTLPGVGRKTANCVLNYGFSKPAIAVDTHVHRISNRIGIVETRTPEETEMRLMEIIPEHQWVSINGLIVRFGQDVCRPVGPRCGECVLADVCGSYEDKGNSD
ncbi:MAG TPA: endonuclease III [Candidatus Methanoperedenaceae archaeon]|nr:endonuclease III [Candidatus Methanoperedenaceae archaeon]